MFKNLLIAFVIVLLILAGGAYYVYANRAVLAQKVVNYVMDAAVGQFAPSEEQENQTWLASLLGTGSKDMKKALTEAVINKGLDTFTKSDDSSKKEAKNMKPGLATFADMLANGAGSDSNTGTQQVASAFLSMLGKELTEQTAEPSYSEHDINARDAKGRTLLINVCRLEVSPQILKMILKYGADINAQDNSGRTALMYAAGLQSDIDVVTFLVENGADVELEDNDGNTALNYAKTVDVQHYLAKQ